jgi:hypothetical protein
MCPLILSYLCIQFPQDTKSFMCVEKPNPHIIKSFEGQVRCMIGLRKGPAAWFPAGTRMVMF